MNKPAARRLAVDAAANQTAVTKSLVARALVDRAGTAAAQPVNEGQGLAASARPPVPRAAKGVKRKVPQKGMDIAGLGKENEAPQMAQGSKEAAGRLSLLLVVEPGGLDISISAMCFQCSMLFRAHQRCRCWPILFSMIGLCSCHRAGKGSSKEEDQAGGPRLGSSGDQGPPKTCRGQAG